MAVPYEYYRIFYFVAKYGSFTRAAKILMNSQPNITRSINNLEQELGCRLFLRSHKGASLTPEGSRLYAHVRIAHEQLQAGEAELAGAKNLLGGDLFLGASEIALHGLLLPVLRAFRLAYPGIHIRITNHSTPQAVDAVRRGLLELAVVTTPTDVAPPLREIPLLPFRDILLAGPGFRSLADRDLRLSDVAQRPLVCLGRETKTYQFYDRLFARHGLALRPDIEVATTDQILPMVKHDLGLGFLPEFFAQDAIDRGEVVRLRLQTPIPPRSICLVRDGDRPLSAAAQALDAMLRAPSAR